MRLETLNLPLIFNPRISWSMNNAHQIVNEFLENQNSNEETYLELSGKVRKCFSEEDKNAIEQLLFFRLLPFKTKKLSIDILPVKSFFDSEITKAKNDKIHGIIQKILFSE
jgi:hypothetical protein